MVRFFDEENFENRINWVDSNNVFLGMETYQQCCEYWGYKVTRELLTKKNYNKIKEVALPEENDYFFDVNYAKITYTDDLGNCVTFKIVSEQDKNDILYITLHNHHNGYYFHGFEFKNHDEIITRGVV